MFSTKNYRLIFGLFIFIASCKKWDDHINVTEQALNENLMEHIGKLNNLSVFRDYLVKTGLDKELSSSKNYTVYAPANDALQALPADVVNDTAKLKAYLLNHISGQLFFTRMATDTVRVPMMNGKRVFFFNKKFDEANITQPDIYVRNGVLHVIDKIVPPLPSVWEYIVNTKGSYDQNAYISSLVYQSQDPTKAQLDSINPVTGEPVYKPNTGIVQINTFRTKVYDIANEDSLYTYVLLTNSAYTTELARQKPYFKSADAAITNSNAAWNAVKDFAIKGMYLPEQLPAALTSKFNVNVPMKKPAIVSTQKVSNGIVYIMSEAAAPMDQKIPASIVQGETPDSLSSYLDRYITKIFYRQRIDSSTGRQFKDIYLNLGSSGANYYVDYISNELYTTKYKLYWVALNDKTISGQGDDPYGTDSTLQQILKIGPWNVPFTTSTWSVQTAVKPKDYKEIYLGEYTNDTYDWQLSYPVRTPDGKTYTYNPATRRIRLQAPATTTTGVPYNLTLDYIRFVPVL